MQHKKPALGLRFTLEQIAALVTSTEGSAWGFHVETDVGNPQHRYGIHTIYLRR